jgi:hypothetical protein
MDEALVIRRNPRVQARKLAGSGGAVLLNLDTAAYHGVNETGWIIWDTVGDGIPFGQLLPEVEARIEDGPDTLDQEVEAFVAALLERHLLIAGVSADDPSTGGTTPTHPTVEPPA